MVLRGLGGGTRCLLALPSRAAVALAMVVALTGTARAQPEGAAPGGSSARAAYLRGLEAVEDGRWADAHESFERAYALSRHPAALFNVGVALRGLGRVREARDIFVRLLEVSAGVLDAEVRALAERYAIEADAQLGSVRLVGLPTDDVVVLLDGRRLGRGLGTELELELDPGLHAISVDARGYDTFRWQGEVREADRITVRVLLEEEGIGAWPFLIGGAALVAVAGVVVAILLSQESELYRPTVPQVP